MVIIARDIFGRIYCSKVKLWLEMGFDGFLGVKKKPYSESQEGVLDKKKSYSSRIYALDYYC